MSLGTIWRTSCRGWLAALLLVAAPAAKADAQGLGPRPVRNAAAAADDEQAASDTNKQITPPTEEPTDPEPELPEDGDAIIRRAYALTTGAKTAEEFNAVIELCQQGIEKGAGAENAAYASTLMGWTYNRLGETHAAEAREEDALAAFSSAVSLDSTLWRAIHNRGVSYATLGKYKEALADFNRTIELNRNYANAWFNRGELRYEQGDFNGALQDYSQALRLAPKDAAAYNSRGHAYYRLGSAREAMRDYDQAVRLSPRDAAILTNRGDAHAYQGNYAQAAQDFRAAIQLNSQLGRAYQSAAWLMSTCPDARYRNPQLGLESANKAIELEGEEDFRYLETLAAAYANAGLFDKAQEVQARAAEAAPEQEAARFQRRLNLYKSGRAYREGGPSVQSPPVRQFRTR